MAATLLGSASTDRLHGWSLASAFLRLLLAAALALGVCFQALPGEAWANEEEPVIIGPFSDKDFESKDFSPQTFTDEYGTYYLLPFYIGLSVSAPERLDFYPNTLYMYNALGGKNTLYSSSDIESIESTNWKYSSLEKTSDEKYYIIPVWLYSEETIAISDMTLYFLAKGGFKMAYETTVSFESIAKTPVNVPDFAEVTYTGKEQPISVSSGDGYSIKSYADAAGNEINAPKDAGKYYVTLELSENCEWVNSNVPEDAKLNDDGTVTVPYVISSAMLTVKMKEDYTIPIGGTLNQEDAQALVVVDGFVNGEKESDFADFKRPQVVLPQELDTSIFGSTGAITFDTSDANATANYRFETINGTVRVGEYTSVARPSISDRLTYTGTAQQLESNVGYNISYTNSAGETVEAPVNAGTYHVTATLNPGYEWEDKTTGAYEFDLTINKAQIEAYVSDQTITQGDSSLPLMNIETGNQKTDKAAVALGLPEGKTAESENITLAFSIVDRYGTKIADVSSGLTALKYDPNYYITVSCEAQNYDIRVTNANRGKLSFNRPDIELSSVSDLHFTYTGEEQDIQSLIKAKNLPCLVVNDEKTDLKATNAGTYKCNLVNDTGNYSLVGEGVIPGANSTEVTWTIDKAPLTVKVGDLTMTQGDKDATLDDVTVGITSGSLLGDDTSADVTLPKVALTGISGVELANLPAGTYDIGIDSTTGTAENYYFVADPGKLTVTAAENSELKEATLTPGASAQSALNALIVKGDAVTVDLAYEGRDDVSASDVTVVCNDKVSATYNPATGKLTVTPLALGDGTISISVAGDDEYNPASIQLTAKVSATPLDVDDGTLPLVVGGDAWTLDYPGDLSYTVDSAGASHIKVDKTTTNGTTRLTVSGVSEGEAQLTVTAVGTSLDPAVVKFKVTDPTKKDEASDKPIVSLDPVKVEAGKEISGSVTLTNADGHPVSGSVKVTSSDESIATATYAEGKLVIKGVTPGECTVTLSSDEVDSDYVVKVTVIDAADNSDEKDDDSDPADDPADKDDANDPDKTTGAGLSKTGDSSMTIVWGSVAVIAIAAGVTGASAVVRKRREKTSDSTSE